MEGDLEPGSGKPGRTPRWPTRDLQAGSIAVFAVLGVAFVDYQLTSARLPELPADFMASDPERIARGDLQNGYVDRAWVYSLLIIATIALVVFLTARATASGGRKALFTDLGVVGVLSGLIALVITISGPYLLDPSSKVMVWLPTLAMLAAAAIGSLVSGSPAGGGAAIPTSGSGAPESVGDRPPLARLGRNALGLSAIAIVLLSIGSTGTACGAESSGASGVLLIAALILGAFVGLIGLAALFVRRWVLATLAILFPALILFGIASAIGPCLS